MRTIVKGKNFEVPAADRQYAERKLARLGRLVDEPSDALVELSAEHHRSIPQSCIVEVTLVSDGQPLRGVARATSHRAAIDEVVDKLERRAVDFKERPRVRSRPVAEKAILRTLADGTREERRERSGVVKVKRFAIQPMFEEDAIAAMEELGHSFFVFVNAENERIGVLYRRRDGQYGLIEPSVGGAYAPLLEARA